MTHSEVNQDLRERAEKFWFNCPDMKSIPDAIAEFASEVSAEKDRRIAHLKEQVEIYSNSTVNAMDVIDDLQNRNAELEAEVERLKEIEFRYNSVSK